MIVCFFRHGVAVEAGATPHADDERPLTEEGARRTRQAARGLLRLKFGFDSVLTSPLPRARETAGILAEVLGLPRPKTADLLLPSSTAAQLLEILRDVEGNAPILVGHEPSLSAAISLFVSATESGSIRMRKAGAAIAKLRTLTPRPRGTLELLFSSRVLRRLAE